MTGPDYICRVAHRNVDRLQCRDYEGGGYQCERTVHTDGAHSIGAHTVEHVLMGSMYTCDAVERRINEELHGYMLW